MRRLAFVTALAATPAVFGVSPAFAQCASGTSNQIIGGGCEANATGGNNTAVGPIVNSTAVNASGDGGGGNTAVGGLADAHNANGTGGAKNTAVGFETNASGNGIGGNEAAMWRSGQAPTPAAT